MNIWLPIRVGYENDRHSTVDHHAAAPFVRTKVPPLPRCGEAVTPNCLGDPPVDRDERNDHPSHRRIRIFKQQLWLYQSNYPR
ncbi:hypothetical protein TNCV_1419391 [Trichonephila clavipes]|nr:hypothetical protein TNCV_1419391 [Trichonephila clavipes]